MAWRVADTIKFTDNSQFTFEIPNSWLERINQQLGNAPLTQAQSSMSFDVTDTPDEVKNYSISQNPFQCEQPNTANGTYNLDSDNDITFITSTIYECWYHSGGISVGGVSNITSTLGNGHGSYAVVPFINDDTQEGFWGIFKTWWRINIGNIEFRLPGININYLNDIYNAIVGAIPPAYTWTSVPAISGKNGILSLSTLNDINDGEPIETSDISKFNLTDDSNVSALVTAHFSQ